jgi:hypothetical protein
MLKSFIASNFQGECIVDEDFIPYLEGLNTVAIRHNVRVVVTSSARKDIHVIGAIVNPAKKGNHLIAHAIDFNVVNLETGEYYNSTKLGDGTGVDEKFCLDVVKETGLFWGDAFVKPDSVHMDDRLNLKNPELWQQKYNALHAIV